MATTSPTGASPVPSSRLASSAILGGVFRAGIAAAERESVKAGGKPIEVVRSTITDTTRMALGA